MNELLSGVDRKTCASPYYP